MNKVKCFCGECETENNYYQCKSCNRIVPWCFGASDKYWEYCDDCAVKLFEQEDQLMCSVDNTVLPNRNTSDFTRG